MTAITLPLWIYLLAISGIGNVSVSFSFLVTEAQISPIIVGDNQFVPVVGTKGGGGQSIDQREISFLDGTYRADVWWYPPLQNYLCGGSGCRIHLKTLIDDPERS